MKTAMKGNGTRRFQVPNRTQVEFRSSDELLPFDSPVRGVWDFVQKMGVSSLEKRYKSMVGRAGRTPVHPAILLAVWLLGISRGIVTSRVLAQACRRDDEFKWLCGGVSVNYHTLSDFRSQDPKLIDELLTNGLAVLSHAGLVNSRVLFVDGTKVDANAAPGQYRREETLQKRLLEAREALQRLESMSDHEKQSLSKRQLSARHRHAEECVRRIEQAVNKLPVRAEARRQAGLDPKETRASSTDPDATRMRRQDGGYRQSYNVQIGVTVTDENRPVITAAQATETVSDHGKIHLSVEETQRRLGASSELKQVVADNGYLDVESVQQMEQTGVEFIAPDNTAEARQDNPFAVDRFEQIDEKRVRCPAGQVLKLRSREQRGARKLLIFRADDCTACPHKDQCCPKARKGRTVKLLVPEQRAAMAQHRQRMNTEEAQQLSRRRKQVAELIMAQLKSKDALRELQVRGTEKATGWVRLASLAHNAMVWIRSCYLPDRERAQQLAMLAPLQP